MLRDSLPHALFGWEDAEKGELTAAHDRLTVNEYGELAVMARDCFYRNAKLSAQVGRHPGSLDRRHSVATPTNRDPHVNSPLMCNDDDF